MRWIRGVRGAEPPAPFPLCRILDVPTLCGLYFWLTIKNGERTAPTTVRPFSIHQTNSMCAKKEDAFVTGVLCHSSTPMIRKNVLACKLIRIKSSASRLYQSQKEGFRPEQETCPYCGSRGCCARFASYERYVLDFLDGRPVCETVRIPRIRCGSCRRTHAILTDSLIPYRSYSLFFILRVIGEYLLPICGLLKNFAHVSESPIPCFTGGSVSSSSTRLNGSGTWQIWSRHRSLFSSISYSCRSTALFPADSARGPCCHFSSHT